VEVNFENVRAAFCKGKDGRIFEVFAVVEFELNELVSMCEKGNNTHSLNIFAVHGNSNH
jgi:hypothetical protein